MGKSKAYGLLFAVLLGMAACQGCVKSEDALREHYRNRSGYTGESMDFCRDLSGQEGTDISDGQETTRDLMDMYGLEHLQDQKLYWDGTVLQMDFYFSKDVTYSELDSARFLVLKKFVVGSLNMNAMISYERWMITADGIREIPQVRCRLFADGSLLFQDNYKDRRVEGYYEDSARFLKAREADFRGKEAFGALIAGSIKDSGVSFQDSLVGDRLLILLETPKVPSMSKLDAVQRDIEDMASEQLTQYPFIVLTMVSGGEPYFTSVYKNSGEDAEWAAMDWVNAPPDES